MSVLDLNSKHGKFDFVSDGKMHPITVPARWLQADDFRLDAAFYAEKAFLALRVLRESGLHIKPLGDSGITQAVFNLSRFKRIYTSDPSEGWPYLGANEVFAFRPKSHRWLARDKAPPNSDKHFVKAGWLLVSCSGVVGRCILAGERLEPFFITHDLIRIISVLPPGYLYAYLSSWIGQALLTHQEYGGTISHLEPQHVARIPVPVLPAEEMNAIHKRVILAYAMREKARRLLDEAERLLILRLGLAPFDEPQVPYLFGCRKPEIFSVRVGEMCGRLDASFHTPATKAVIKSLRDGKYPLIPLSEVAHKIVIPPRFKRIYVAPEHGVPFLRPSDMLMIKPYDLKFLSRSVTQVLDSLMLNEGEVLVATDGTVGEIGYVTKYLRGWAGSNNLARISCGQGKEVSRNGYIAAFLMSSYGYHQLTRETYGGVVDHLEEEHLAKVLLPDAPQEIQEEIGQRVIKAFELKDKANILENRIIAYLEQKLDQVFVRK